MSTKAISGQSRPDNLRIFLCHSSADKTIVRELYNRLLSDGLLPWLDQEDLLPGQDWAQEIPKVVRNSDVVLVCLSNSSITKTGFVQKEIRFALDVADMQPEGTIFLIPLRLEPCDVPQRLGRWQWVDYFASDGYSKLLRALEFRSQSQISNNSKAPHPSESILHVKQPQVTKPRVMEVAFNEIEARETTTVDRAQDFLSPASFISAAKAADPNFPFALATAGILGIVVIFVNYGIAYTTLVFGAIALIGLMVAYFVFAQAIKLARSKLDIPAQVLIWSFLVIIIAASGFLSWSVFFNTPLPFRDWLVQKLSNKGNAAIVASATPPSAVSNDMVQVEKDLIINEVIDAYKPTGWQLAFFEDWGRPPTRQTLRVNQGVLVGTATDGRSVSISVDPHQLPTPQHYNAYLAQISRLGNDAPIVVNFFDSYSRYREALAKLSSNPTDLNVALIDATASAREAISRGHAALCAMGRTPPRLFPDGGFPEPISPSCATVELKKLK